MRVIVSECDDFEDCDVTGLTPSSRVTSSMTPPIDAPYTFLLDTNPWMA